MQHLRSTIAIGLGLVAIVATARAADLPRYGAESVGRSTTAWPYRVVAMDLDGDGIDDIVAANGYNETHHAMVSNGDGTFQPPGMFNDLGGLFDVAAVDLNQDPYPDLVTSAGSVFISNGDGTFAPYVNYSAGGTIAAGDFDRDGLQDVIWNGEGHAGFGDGTLDTAIVLFGGVSGSIVSADFDEDSLLDVAVFQFLPDPPYERFVQVFRNEGGWVFSMSDSFGVASPSYRLAADLDDDDHVDLLVGETFHPGHGDGTFGPPAVYGTPGELGIHVVDIDGDGIPDLVTSTSSPSPKHIRVRLGTGGGAFGPATEFAHDRSELNVAPGDFDGDGHLDLAMVGWSGVRMAALFGHGDGTFGDPFDTYPVPGTPLAVTVADIVGDGALDVVVSATGTGFVRVYPGLGDGTLDLPVDLATPADPQTAMVLDVDSNTVPDLVVAGVGFVSVFPGAGGGVLGPRIDRTITGTAYGLTSGDLNGDTRPDILSVGSRLSVILTQMDGSPGLPAEYNAFGFDVQVAEITGDTHPDVVIGYDDSFGGIRVLPGSANGTLGTVSTTPIANGYGSLLVTDLTGDGIPDVLFAYRTQILLLPGRGDGTWDPSVVMPNGVLHRSTKSMRLVDLTDDGIADLVTSDYEGHAFDVSPGLGGGLYGPPTVYGAGGYPNDAAVGDLDGDGVPEIVVANTWSGTVTVHHPLPDGTLDAGPRPGTPSALAFTRVWPVPSRGAVNLTFTLATREPATIELLDLAGRRVHRQELGDASPGRRTLRLAPDQVLEPGVYWVRLVQDGARASAPVIVLE